MGCVSPVAVFRRQVDGCIGVVMVRAVQQGIDQLMSSAAG